MDEEQENEFYENLLRSVVTGPPEHVIQRAIALTTEKPETRGSGTEEDAI